MSGNNALPSSAPAGGIDGGNPTVRFRLEEDGTVRVWLRHNVLGGRAGAWHYVDPAHPDLPRLIALDAVRVPDPDTGELPDVPVVAARGCRGCP